MNLSNPCPPKTRTDLEWDRVLAALAERCTSAMGRDLALALPFPETREAVRTVLAESEEATRLLAQGEPLPLHEIPGVHEAVSRLRVGGVLGPQELRGLARVLTSARSLRRFLSARKATVPALFAACATDPTLDPLADEVSNSFEADGTLADRASPRLRELRGEYQAARQRMIARLEDLMGRYEGILQDRFVTEREGRYVIPVRSDAHERFPGLVHATSSSGATLFVEPRAVIPMGNRLKVLEAEVQREEIAVYTRLTALLADVLPSLEGCVHALSIADVRAATARLAQDLRLVFPEVVDDPRLDLVAARHPLLALDFAPTPGRAREGAEAGREVVPSDLAIASGKAMIVSGPNAGGKTVALKTMGLCALLVRAGLPVPCAEGSVVGLFDLVLTDVGDDQSLQKNLSTFSAHVQNLAAILSETSRGTLVLLDELAGGTDPREGEALAAGVLDSLCARGGAVAVTTHYEGLKALALADTRFQNASVGLDLATMTPTFRLAIGVPGSSSALAVARRHGMPSTVLERAERFLSREDQNFETVVKRLHDERAALELARQAAEAREQEVRALKIQLEAELERARGRERQTLTHEAQELMGRLLRAKEDVRSAQARLRSKKLDEAAVREASRSVERVAAEVAVGGPLESLVTRLDQTPREAVRVDDLRKGARVYVSRLRAEADVVDVLADGTVRVAAGPLKLVVSPSELRAPAAPAPEAPKKGAKARAVANDVAIEPAIQTSDNSCDLRGLRVDDGLAMAATFLDRSISAGRRVAFLIHGHGTGALRDAIRKELQGNRFVAHYRGGSSDEGGDGVTVVWLA
jgi:DNA mismatch repair protein MutS2